VADDHPSVRENLRYIINAETDLECVGVAKDGPQAMKLTRELAPDVLVLDDEMPGHIDGLEIAGSLSGELPGLRIVLYTLDTEVCAEASSFGAFGCVMKDQPTELLLATIREAAGKTIRAG
jgi:DNA-binding NarL/FixJ family response regulator